MAALAVGVFSGCESSDQREEFVARVHDQYLTREELDEAMGAMPPRVDSADVRKQIIEQWVTSALLFDEASRRGLRENEDVRRQLQESERSVMASALLSRLYEEESAEPSPSEIQAYFERNKELFRIREPFVRVRHLVHANRDTVVQARQAMLSLARGDNPDSTWQLVVAEHAEDPESSLDLSATHLPQSHLFSNQPVVREALNSLRPGETSPVLEVDDRFHVLQLVDRAAPGALPQIEWVEAELRRRLVIQGRKQIYASQVQRLRNEALAREELEIR